MVFLKLSTKRYYIPVTWDHTQILRVLEDKEPFSYIYKSTYKLRLTFENFQMLSNGNWETSTLFSLTSMYLFLLLFLLSIVLETEKSF